MDMIREYGTKDVFYVIDINYFPGKYNQLFCIPWFFLVSFTLELNLN